MKPVAMEAQDAGHGYRMWRSSRWGIITVPTGHCFAILGSHGLPRNEKERRQLCFRLEDDLFFDAEEIAFDLLAAGEQQIAIVAKRSELDDALSQCESTLAVVPESLLLLQGLRTGISPTSKVSPQNGARQALFLFHEDWVEYLEWDKANLFRWSIHDSEEADTLFQQHCSDSNAEVDTVWSIRVADRQDLDPSEPYRETEVQSIAPSEYHELVRRTVHQILTGQQRPIVNLRSNGQRTPAPLAPALPALGMAMAAGMFLLATVAFAFVYRGWSYRERAELIATEQAEVFSELFPGQRIPVGLTGRIESEYRRLKATRSEGQILDVTALPVLHQFIANTPDSFRFQVQRVEFATNELTRVEGLVEGLRELELLRESYQAAGFRVPPLRAEQVANGVIINWANVAWTPSTQVESVEAPVSTKADDSVASRGVGLEVSDD